MIKEADNLSQSEGSVTLNVSIASFQSALNKQKFLRLLMLASWIQEQNQSALLSSFVAFFISFITVGSLSRTKLFGQRMLVIALAIKSLKYAKKLKNTFRSQQKQLQIICLSCHATAQLKLKLSSTIQLSEIDFELISSFHSSLSNRCRGQSCLAGGCLS